MDSSTGEIKVKKKRKNRYQIQKEISTDPERAKLFKERSAYQKKVQEGTSEFNLTKYWVVFKHVHYF